MATLDLGNVMGPQGPQGEQGEPGPPVDTSTLIQQSEKGAADGVASLDRNGNLMQTFAPVWETPTLSSGYSYDPAQLAYRPNYCKCGNVVTVSGLLTAWTPGTSMFVLPKGFRPKYSVRSIQIITNQGAAQRGFAALTINNADGRVSIINTSAVTESDMQWLFFHCSFICDTTA